MNPVATAASDYEAEGSGLLRASQLSAPSRTVAAVFKAVVPTAVQGLRLHPKTLNGTMPAGASHRRFMDRRKDRDGRHVRLMSAATVCRRFAQREKYPGWEYSSLVKTVRTARAPRHQLVARLGKLHGAEPRKLSRLVHEEWFPQTAMDLLLSYEVFAGNTRDRALGGAATARQHHGRDIRPWPEIVSFRVRRRTPAV